MNSKNIISNRPIKIAEITASFKIFKAFFSSFLYKAKDKNIAKKNNDIDKGKGKGKFAMVSSISLASNLSNIYITKSANKAALL